MSVATPIAPPHRAPADLSRDRAPLLPLGRPEPALAVLALLSDAQLRLAGTLLRPAPALALIPDPPAPVTAAPEGAIVPLDLPALEQRRGRALHRAIAAATAAGFDVEAAETLLPGELAQRLRDLDPRPTIVVAGTRRPRRIRALASAAAAPVLALPPRGAGTGGPVVVSGEDVHACVATIARTVAVSDLVIVGPPSPSREAARAFAGRMGLRTEVIGGRDREAAATVASELDGLLVMCDHGTRRSAREIGRRLLGRRPALIVPRRGARL